MDALGAIVLIAGLFWLTRRTLAGASYATSTRVETFPSSKIAAWDRLLDWLGSLPAWPGAAFVFIVVSMIFWL